MTFLKKSDYYFLIQQSNLDVVLYSDDSFLSQMELVSQSEIESYIRHRYDVKRIFKNILTYADATAFKQGDIIEYTIEPTFSASTIYTTGQRVSYLGNIYASKAGSAAHAWNAAEWTLICSEYSLFYTNIATTGNKPTNNFTYSSNAYTGNHGSITGWNKANTLYFKAVKVDLNNNTEIKIYSSSTDRTSDINYIGRIVTTQAEIVLPKVVLIETGYYDTLGGELDIVGFIPNGTTWEVTATNYWTLGDNRNQQIKTYCIDLTLYHIHSRINPRNIPEIRVNRRDDAINWLKMIADGRITADLPINADSNQGQRLTFGGQTQMNHEY